MFPSDPTDPVYALAVAPNGIGFAAGVCFAARASGLYRSTDAETWHSAYEALRLSAPLSTTALALAPDGTLFAGVPGGILRSPDAGASWHVTPLPDPPPLVSALAASPAFQADGFLLATTFQRGVFYSTDRGETWLTGNFSLMDYHVLGVVFSPEFATDRTALIGTETGAFISTNGGRSWQDVDLPYVAVSSLAFAPDGSVYAGTDGDGIYVSPDKGRTWGRSSLPSTLTIDLILTASSQEILAFAGETLYHSRDAGETWRTRRLPATATAAALLGSAALLVGFADGTISRIAFAE